MGNQHSNKRKSLDDTENMKRTNSSHNVKKRKKKSKVNSTASDGIRSIMDPVNISTLPSTEKYPSEDRKLDLKFYPSYLNGNNRLNKLEESPDNIKLYRGNKEPVGHQYRNATSLRNYHSLAVRDYPELGRKSFRWDSLTNSARSSVRASGTSSPRNICHGVTKEDFPSSVVVRQRLCQFEHAFIHSVSQKFGSLPCKTQLASLSVAIRPFAASQASISLFSYLKSQIIPIDLRSGTCGKVPSEYILTIPTALFLELMHLRRERAFDPSVLAKAARDVVTCVVGEVVHEISRMFEYQIALLNEKTSIEMLADHAADCVISYTVKRSGRLLDRNTVVQGVLRGQPKIGRSRFISVIIGSQELKWELSKIFKKPGIRKDALLFAKTSELQKFNGPVWTFHASKDGEPLLYGYRGLMIEWDFQDEIYRLGSEDEKLLDDDETTSLLGDDFHRLYKPYQCLVGVAAVACCKVVNKGAVDNAVLTNYTRSLLGVADHCGEIQPVFYPLGCHGDAVESTGLSRIICENLLQSRPTHMSAKSSFCNSDDVPNGLKRFYLTQGYPKQDIVQAGHLPARQNMYNGDTDVGMPSVVIATLTESSGDIRDIDDVDPVAGDQVPSEMVSSNSSSVPSEQNYDQKKKQRCWADSISSRRHSAVRQRENCDWPEAKDDGEYAVNEDTKTKLSKNGIICFDKLETNVLNIDHGDGKENQRIIPPTDECTKPCEASNLHLVNQCARERRLYGSPDSKQINENGKQCNMKFSRTSESIDTELTDMRKSPETDSYVPKMTLDAEVKEDTRTKILQALEVLRVRDIPTQLPEAKLYGRRTQVSHLTEMLVPAGALVTITGCYGIGKSALAISIGHSLKKKSITSVYIDCRGCCTVASLMHRLVSQFGLRFRLGEMSWFYNWLNCHEQQLLLILDNVDLPEDDDETLSYITDDLLHSVPKLRIVCTRTHPFYRGKVASGRRTYRIGDIRESSGSLFLQVTPDLRDKDIQKLSSLCCHIPFAIRLISNVLAFEDVDPGMLFQSLYSNSHPALASLENDIRDLSRDDREWKQLKGVTACVLAVLENIREVYTEILCKMSGYATGFHLDDVQEALQKNYSPDVTSEALSNLCRLGLLSRKNIDCYHLPPVVKLVCQNLMAEDGFPETFFCVQMLQKLQDACALYSSAEHQSALLAVDLNYDNFTDALMRISEAENAYPSSWVLASLEGAVFLLEFLPEDVCCFFYEMLERTADRNNDISRRCQALCCIAYCHAAQGRVGHAAFAASKAYEISTAVCPPIRAFCFYCLAKVYWYDEAEQRKSLMLAKRAVDLFQEYVGLNDIRTVYACELYGWMLTVAGHLQTARHVYNIADEAVLNGLDGHPQMLNGYGCRRAIWDELGLYERAKQTARKAYQLTLTMYGEHPATGNALMQLCDSIVKRGSLSDAICVSIHALAMRIKVLGESFDTGMSYKMLTCLMLRQTQYEGAAAFGQRAIEIFKKMGADEALIAELNDIVCQSKLKMAASRLPKVVPAETKEICNKKNVTFQELVRTREHLQSKTSAEV